MKQKKQVWCQARPASHNSPCFGVTIGAVTKPSDSGRLRRQFVSAVLQRKLGGKGLAHLKNRQWKAVVGKEGASVQAMENAGKRPEISLKVGILLA